MPRKGEYQNRPTTHGSGFFAAQKRRWDQDREEREKKLNSVSLEQCPYCSLTVLCAKGKWYDEIGIVHVHQPGVLLKAALKEAAASSGYGKAAKKSAVVEEEEGEE
jgi:hypothetical protein